MQPSAFRRPSGLWPTGPKQGLCKAGWCRGWVDDDDDADADADDADDEADDDEEEDDDNDDHRDEDDVMM